ncbi:unnamed protein product [Soboliphyme baturini]|uniref:Golgi apparatus membrane protein TVP23 homolog n=1 Tax=Soboliphyme baturini TaxID=241478 RepID=A0A183IYU2_9BILA|nr:unnamed protein product [Soboliphyme baturini]
MWLGEGNSNSCLPTFAVVSELAKDRLTSGDIIFSALDFWTVKNVTGRLLVGLRWRNYVDEDGSSHWQFESKNTKTEQNVVETQIFWFVLIFFPMLWTIFSLVAFLTLKWTWLVVVLFATAMTGSNLYGYLRCKWHSRQELRSYVSQNLLWKVNGLIYAAMNSESDP